MSQTPPPDELWYTAEEVAQWLRTKPVVVSRKCRAGTIPATKPFGSWLISKRTVEELLRDKSNQQSDTGTAA